MFARTMIKVLTVWFFFALVASAYGGVLDGKFFTGKNGHMGKGASGDDEIYFSDGKFTSIGCKKWAFGDASYTAKEDGDRIFFTADIFSQKYGRITYTGIVEGENISANYFWFDKGKYEKPEQIKWFKGTAK